LDAPTNVVRGLVPGEDEPAQVVPFEAAVVGDVTGAVGADGSAVRPAPALGDDRDAAVGSDPGQRAATDLDDQHAAVGRGEGALGELETGRDRTQESVLSTGHHRREHCQEAHKEGAVLTRTAGREIRTPTSFATGLLAWEGREYLTSDDGG